MQEKNHDSDLVIANRLFRENDYSRAKFYYNKIFRDSPQLREIVKFNAMLCERRSEKKPKGHSENIFVGIAAIPEREKALEKTIASLINQAPRIGVYLNGWKDIPDYLKNDKIHIAGFGGEDLGDVGKFYWVDDHDGVYFTCDDDLVYPKDYIQRTLLKLEDYNYQAAIGWHGSLILEPFNNYYDKASRRVFVFSSDRPYDTPVHILGTGCCAFHTKTLKISKSDFVHPNMADVFFSIKGQEQKVPFVILKHEQSEIKEVEGSKESSIYAHSHTGVESRKNTRELQNEYVVSHAPWTLYRGGKNSILIIGRFDAYKKGGIYKSCHLIKEHLISLGHRVDALDTSKELSPDILKDCDLCWIYPGDPKRPDFNSVDGKIEMLSSLGVPVLVNLSYLYEEERSRWMVAKLKEYNKKGNAPVMAAVFTESAANDPMLAEVRDFICVVPKTIQPNPYDAQPSFEEREGICLGDATKLANEDIIGGSVNQWIDEIHKRLPDVNLYAYKQYKGENPHPKVKYVSHMSDDFGEWLAYRRIFVCANVHLTFEMVACEAQQYGTPSIYRHMPHSLSEYISATGIAVRTPEEMGEMVYWLYNNKVVWDKLSKSSYFNACSKHVDFLDASLEGYIKLAIYRAKKIKAG